MTTAVRVEGRWLDDTIVGMLSHALAVVGTLLAVSALAAGQLRLDDLGLHGSVGIPYYVGLVLLPAASILQFVRGTRANTWAIVLHLVVFIVIVWTTPVLLEGTARFRTSYANYGDVDPLVRGLGLQPSDFIYHNWPLFPILMAALVGLGVPTEPLLALFPVVLMLLYMPALGALLSITERAVGRPAGDAEVAALEPVEPREAVPDAGQPRRRLDGFRAVGRRFRLSGAAAMALWILPLFDWTGQDYFSPQAFAYLLLLVMLAILADVGLRQEGRLSPLRLSLLLVVFTAIVATHVLTALVALSVILTMSVARLVRRPTLVMTTLAIFVVWQVYVAAPFLDFYREPLLNGLLSLGSFLQRNLAERVQGSEGHASVVQLRILVTLMAFGLGVAALAVLGRSHGFRAPVARFVVAGVVAVALVAPVTVYGGEALIRALLFGIPFLAVAAALALRSELFMLATTAALAVAALTHPFTHYGNELYDYVSPAEVKAFDFVAGLGPANVYGGAPAAQFLNTAELDFRNASLPRGGELEGVEGYLRPLDHAWADPTLPLYVAVSRGDDAALRLFHDQPGFMTEIRDALDGNPDFKIVYDDPDFALYRWIAVSEATAK